jgi:hypothetical protein
MLRRSLAATLVFLILLAVLAKVHQLIQSSSATPVPDSTPATRDLTLSPRQGDHRRLDPADFPAGSVPALDSLSRAGVRVRLGAEAERHYLDSLFSGSDSTVRHWRTGDPIAVAIVPGGPRGFLPEMVSEVRQGLDVWSPAAAGLRFLEQNDTAAADMVIRWTDTLESERAGATDVTWDKAGRIRRVAMFLATRSPSTGRPFAPETRQAIVLHELGHALGLPHSSHSEDVMFPVAAATSLTARDRYSLRLLYELPTGWIGTPPWRPRR